MVYNETGIIANRCWLEIPQHFPNVILHEYIIMPNHIHGIIELCGNMNMIQNNGVTTVGAENFLPLLHQPRNEFQKMIPNSIGSIVKGFKIGVTKWVRNNITNPVGGTDFQPLQVWQRNYYEHIIRNQTSYENITNYIINNPKHWKEDRFHRKNDSIKN